MTLARRPRTIRAWLLPAVAASGQRKGQTMNRFIGTALVGLLLVGAACGPKAGSSRTDGRGTSSTGGTGSGSSGSGSGSGSGTGSGGSGGTTSPTTPDPATQPSVQPAPPGG